MVRKLLIIILIIGARGGNCSSAPAMVSVSYRLQVAETPENAMVAGVSGPKWPDRDAMAGRAVR